MLHYTCLIRCPRGVHRTRRGHGVGWGNGPHPGVGARTERDIVATRRVPGSDDTTLAPDDRTKYTLAFGADGQLTARIDCNRGRGSWASSAPNQLQLGPLALTRAQCPPGSLHDQIVKQWSSIRSYVLRDGRLFLASDPGVGVTRPVMYVLWS